MNIVFPGTFEPFHAGHLNIVKILKRKFPNETIIISKSYNPAKSLSDISERDALTAIKDTLCVNGIKNVEVCSVFDLSSYAGFSDNYTVVKRIKSSVDERELTSTLHINNNSDFMLIRSDEEFDNFSSFNMTTGYVEDMKVGSASNILNRKHFGFKDIIFVSGPPGFGKSTIINSLIKSNPMFATINLDNQTYRLIIESVFRFMFTKEFGSYERGMILNFWEESVQTQQKILCAMNKAYSKALNMCIHGFKNANNSFSGILLVEMGHVSLPKYDFHSRFTDKMVNVYSSNCTTSFNGNAINMNHGTDNATGRLDPVKYRDLLVQQNKKISDFVFTMFSRDYYVYKNRVGLRMVNFDVDLWKDPIINSHMLGKLITERLL